MNSQFKFTGILSKTFSYHFAAFLVLLLFVTSRADVCVWRNPERTMSRVFSKAKDYKTIDTKIDDKKRAVIEKALGEKLAPGERENWTYYQITGENSNILGHIIADAEKGEYGVIEIVMGIFPDGKVKQVYIQRDREKNKEFKSREFLSKFEGKTVKDSLVIGKDIQVKESSLPVKMTIFGVRKMLIFYEQLANRNK